MCGVWATLGQPLGRSLLDVMAHRGPDGEGFVAETVRGQLVEFGHRRLAIIDLDHRSDQPMSSDDGRYVIVFNGEIYNFLELRQELVVEGYNFRTQSDTEVLLAAWAKWGERSLGRLVGMFAFILLDKVAGEVIVARDPFGIKPLYYARTQNGVAFASEIPPLLQCPGVTRVGHAEAAYKYVLSGLTDGRSQTLFRDIQSFPAAHVCRITLGTKATVEPRAYWRPTIDQASYSFDEAASRLRELFLRSVNLHLRSDVPVGAALSGGIDSSAIVGAMRLIGGASLDVHAFSFVAPDSAVDESHWIGIAARNAQAKSHVVAAEPSELLGHVDELIKLQGEPFGSTSIYAQYRVMQLASRNGIKVMLDGQGADELFAGYRPYLANRLAELLRRGQVLEALAFLRAAARLPGTSHSTIALQALGALAPAALIPLGRKAIGKPLSPAWLDGPWLRERGVLFDVSEHHVSRTLHDKLAESLTTTVLPALLRYEDRNSMHFSIESRVPFLTTELADFAYSCPSSLLISRTAETKSVFRAAMRGIVPDEILDRRDKIGFATPELQWLQSLRPWAQTVIQSTGLERLPFLRRGQVMQAFSDMIDGKRPLDFQAWRWLNLIRWAEVFDVRFV